jgi:hypothetical protein
MVIKQIVAENEREPLCNFYLFWVKEALGIWKQQHILVK